MKNNIYKNLYKKSKNNFYDLLKKNLKNEKKNFVITANPETYMTSYKDDEILKILNNKNNLVVPDGIAIVKTAKYLGLDIKERITGVEIAEFLLEEANKNKYKLYLFGAKEEVLNTLVEVIKNKYPNINIVGFKNGYVNDKDKVMNEIKKLNPDITLIALGIPAQEKLINKHIEKFTKGIFIGVGGTFDVLSGIKKRAPKLFIKLNLEWLYRIVTEPKRIKRFYKYNIKFLKLIKKEKNNS